MATQINNATYVIELDRWTIKQGIPVKFNVTVGTNHFLAYDDTAYITAKNNVVGINEALNWAFDNGYRHVTLPNGEYSICYGNYVDVDGKTYSLSIYPQKDTVLDFSNATIKVIYDSDKLSLYNPNTTTYSCPKCGKVVLPQSNGICPTLADPTVGDCGNFIGFHKFVGAAIVVREPNVHIKRIKLIGDRIDRSFSSYYNCINNYPTRDIRIFSEAGNEFSQGIKFADRANGCSVTDSDLSFFMGDNVSTWFQDNGTVAKYQSNIPDFIASQSWGMEFGSLNVSNGVEINGVTNDVRTKYIPIPIGVTSFSLTGLGYQPRTSIPNFKYTVHFYDENKVFRSSFKDARTVDLVYIPIEKAKYIRITFTGNGTLNDGAPHAPYWMELISNGISSNILIARNKIRGGHRGGCFLGGNNVNIEYNEFISNGSTSDLYGLVPFPYMTRYGINSEDNVGHNYKINNNVFTKNRIAIAIRGEYAEISGNEFRQNDIALVLYRLYHASITHNTFNKNAINDYPYNEDTFIRDWNISDNIFVESAIDFSGLSTVSSIENNLFYDSSTNIVGDVVNFSDNSFIATKADKSVNVGGRGIKNCSFKGTSTYSVVVNAKSNITNCYFNYSKVYYTKDIYTGVVRNSRFINSSLTFNGNTTVQALLVKIYDSSFDYTVTKNVIPSGTTFGNNTGYSVEFRNCDFSGLLSPAFGMQHISDLNLYKCRFKWDSPTAIKNPLCEKFWYMEDKLVMEDCSLSSRVDITQDLGTIFTNPCTLNFVDLNKFTFTSRATDNVKLGSPTDNLLQALAAIKDLYSKLP